jgi:hypothetical protein
MPSPVAGFDADDGTELWLPNEAVVAVEGLDFFGGFPADFASTFGFYRSSDPSTLITIFGSDDQDTSGAGSDPQLATIDFLNGEVIDVDDLVVESVFAPAMEPIGFFLNILDLTTSDELTLHTQPTLNLSIGGADAFGSFRNTTDPDVYLLGAEFDAASLLLRVDLVDGINPIPEPAAALAFATGLVVVAVGLRKSSSRT